MIQLTIYSRPGCHLCDDMKEIVRRAMRLAPEAARLAEIDISNDADLEARYGMEVPVLLVDGKKTAKYRVTEDAVVQMLRTRKAGKTEAG